MYELGKTQDTNLAYQVGRVMAEEMAALGINVAFAPVLDIYPNPNNTVIEKRSLGENPNTVSNMAISLAIKVIKENFSEERIDSSVRKILTFKYTYLSESKSFDLSVIGSSSHKEIINKIK